MAKLSLKCQTIRNTSNKPISIYIKRLSTMLIILNLLLPECSAAKRVLDTGVNIESLKNKFGNYIAIYDYQVTKNYKDYAASDEVNCRWISKVLDKPIMSVGRKDNGEVDCRVGHKGIGHYVEFAENAGSIIFMSSGMNSYWPHRTGIFYRLLKNQKQWKTYSELRKACKHQHTYRRSAITKSITTKDLIKHLLKVNNVPAVFLGVYKQGNKMYWDDDDSKFEELSAKEIKDADSIKFTKDGNYESVESEDETLPFFCVYNPFNLEWE